MAQFARPDSDIHVGSWTTDTGGTTNLFAAIDESAASDTDYVQSESAPATSPYAFGLSNVVDPTQSTGHIVRYRYQKDSAGGAQVDLTVQLRQGYVSEASQGTLIAGQTHTNIANGWTAGSFTLSGAEADAITDYTNLQGRLVANQV